MGGRDEMKNANPICYLFILTSFTFHRGLIFALLCSGKNLEGLCFHCQRGLNRGSVPQVLSKVCFALYFWFTLTGSGVLGFCFSFSPCHSLVGLFLFAFHVFVCLILLLSYYLVVELETNSVGIHATAT